jgi:hypothetical protein
MTLILQVQLIPHADCRSLFTRRDRVKRALGTAAF